jgi:hypothetical protein
VSFVMLFSFMKCSKVKKVEIYFFHITSI